MFRVQKQEFGLESICVRTLNRLNRLLLFVSMMVTYMSEKTEKKNNFFHAVIRRPRGTKSPDKIRMFLYRFSAGIKAIIEKVFAGSQHFKYIELQPVRHYAKMNYCE